MMMEHGLWLKISWNLFSLELQVMVSLREESMHCYKCIKKCAHNSEECVEIIFMLLHFWKDKSAQSCIFTRPVQSIELCSEPSGDPSHQTGSLSSFTGMQAWCLKCPYLLSEHVGKKGKMLLVPRYCCRTELWALSMILDGFLCFTKMIGKGQRSIVGH